MSASAGWNVGITVSPDDMEQEEFARRVSAGDSLIENNLAEARRRIGKSGAVIIEENRFGFTFKLQGDCEQLRLLLDGIAEVVSRGQFEEESQRVLAAMRAQPCCVVGPDDAAVFLDQEGT
ncbi:MAG: hypothetical protein Q8P82_00790 [bacterium]|nr:hypothetical protein [bacterium]